MEFLKPDNIRTEHGLEIKEKIIPWGAVWPKDSGNFKKGDQYKADRLLSDGTGKVQYITIHNTDDIVEAVGTNDAEQYARATWPNANMGDVRVHYYIDETDCWQQLREDEVGWHAGDGRGPGNDSSIAIEIIMTGNGYISDQMAEDRGALLAAILLDKHDLSIDQLKAHKDWTGKNCPKYILPHWLKFVEKVKEYLAEIQAPKLELKPAPTPATPILKPVTTGVYNTLEEVPDYAKATISKLVENGWLKGNGAGLALTTDMVRIFTILDRAGVFDK